jgi:hypothetical protein
MTCGNGILIIMNKDYILFHLNEACEELTRTIQELQDNSEYDTEEFKVAMAHLYNHINTAWNARNLSDVTTSKCSHLFL